MFYHIHNNEGHLVETIVCKRNEDIVSIVDTKYPNGGMTVTPMEIESKDLLVIDYTPYQQDLMQLHEQCRKAELTSYQLFLQIDTIANQYVIHAKRVIADLFAC